MPRLLLAAGAAVLLMAMTGCVAPTPPATPEPTATATPVFASEEEALAAAEEAYAAYLAVSDQIFAEGGVNPERLEAVASGGYLATAIAGFDRVRANGWRSVGRSAVLSMDLQKYDAQGLQEIVTVYLCDDVSGVDVVDPGGQSVVSPDRPDHTLFEVTFDLESDSSRLLVSGREVWGDGQC